MFKKTAKKSFMAGGLIFLLLACGCGNQGKQDLDTPTAGRIKVGIDGSYRLMIEAELYTFESLYRNAHIDTLIKAEADVIEDFMNDSVPLIIVSHKLSEEQEKYLNSKQFVPRTTKIAYDAIAFIVNNDNPDTSIFYNKIRDIFLGKISKWQQVNPKSGLNEIQVVFDNYKSSNPRYFRERFNLDSLPGTCVAVKSNAEVISFVSTHLNAMGVIGVNWISDPQDTISNSFLKKVRVVGISPEGNNDPDARFYKPYQAYIAENSYPFTREVYCINRQPYHGLAFGLSSFIAGEKGQLIILRSGLVPAVMPVRIVEIKK